MSWLLTIWGLLFRLFPCPTKVGLRRIGKPGRDSPVLVTCNFHLTIRRLERALRGRDIWLVVADSKGINVWCAAGADELSTDAVVSVVKTCGIADEVDHRRLILPPLAGPGVRAVDVAEQTGWKVRWGPVRAADLNQYLDQGQRRDEAMKRTTWTWTERIDAGLGSMFPFYVFIAIPFAIFGRQLLVHYLVVALVMPVFYLYVSPWLPGRTGIRKALVLIAPLAVLLFFAGPWAEATGLPLRADLIIAIGAVLSYGMELGGMSSTLPSAFDPMMARIGVRKAFNIEFAGTTRTDLLLGMRKLDCDTNACIGCKTCVEICPLGVWAMGEHNKATVLRRDSCTACRACLVQCPTGAIRAIESR